MPIIVKANKKFFRIKECSFCNCKIGYKKEDIKDGILREDGKFYNGHIECPACGFIIYT